MLRAVKISSTNITIAWDAVNCTERNSNITGYVVRYITPSTSGVFSYQGPCSGFTHTNTTTVEGTSRNYTLSELQEFSNYTVNVKAVNDAGNATGMVTLVRTTFQ